MAISRPEFHYNADQLLARGLFVHVMEVEEHQWLLEHDHDFIEIACVVSGKGTHYINGLSYEAADGDVYLLPVGISHVFRPALSASAKLRVRNIIIDWAWLRRLEQFVEDRELEPFLKWLQGNELQWLKVCDTNHSIRSITGRLQAIYLEGGPQLRTRLTNGLLELLIRLYEDWSRLYNADCPFADDFADDLAVSASASTAAKSFEAERIAAALAAIPLTEHSAHAAAAKLQISERHLNRLLHKYFGKSYVRYAQWLRIGQGCRMLEESGNISIAEIAQEVGLQDVAHFSRLFKQSMGLTPLAYRKRLLAQKRLPQDAGAQGL